MLVLSRRKGEALVIRNDIEVRIIEVRGDQVRLGIEAPKDIKIFRKEIYLQIQEEMRWAAQNRPSADALSHWGSLLSQTSKAGTD